MKKEKSTIEQIADFIETESTLTLDSLTEAGLKLTQNIDGKSLEILTSGVDEVLTREDSTGKPFLQVNFVEGTKILITKSLVGFKPALFEGVDPDRIPNVVTTPDLLSIVEALSDFDFEEDYEEYRALRRMYYSILHGAEAVGFEIENERLWISQTKAVA
jgi:hypothetical protein